MEESSFVIPGQAEGLSPETMNTRFEARVPWRPRRSFCAVVIMDSGLAAAQRPGMTTVQPQASNTPLRKSCLPIEKQFSRRIA